MYQKILIVLQGKKTDEAVVAHFEAFAHQLKAELTLLRVITVAHDGAGGLGLQFQLEIGSSGWRRTEQAKQFLPRWERRLHKAGFAVETALAISTQTEADAIVSYAAQKGCDLIAMASDSRLWYQRWIGGSPANGLLRKATVPVLFIDDGTRTAPVEETAPKGHQMMQIFGSANL